LEVLEHFFGKINLPKKETKEGDALWLNPKADKQMDKVVHKKYAPINEIQIQQMEQELQSISRVVFPDWYRSFLQYANGLSLYYGAISLYGLQKVERSNPEWESPSSLYLENLSRHKHVPKEWLFIGCYCYDGTEIVIDTNKEESDIFCLYNETDKVICSWKNFDEFLFTETKRLELLYLQHPWGWLDIKSNTLPVGHKDKN
jgi:hypothetical protein